MISYYYVTSHVNAYARRTRGLSLLEILIVLGILAILGVAGFGMYHNFVKSVELSESAQTIRSDLKATRSKAQAGTDDYRWGIHFVNSSGNANDYYETFSTPTDYADAGKVVKDTVYLRGGVTFSDPTNGNTKDIVFYKIAGTTTAATVGVTFSGDTQTISVGASGSIN